VTDRHSYWLYTTNGDDLKRLAETQERYGFTLPQAVDYLARKDYELRGHTFRPQEGSLLDTLFARRQDEEELMA